MMNVIDGQAGMVGRGEEITVTVDQPDPLLQPDDEATRKKKNKQNKKKEKEKAAKEKKERRKSRADTNTDVIISHPDYDSFRDMADVIKDPQERASMLGSRPLADPSAQLPAGRVKRMFTIIGRKGERRKESLAGSHRERWELIDPEALRKAPLPQTLVVIGSERSTGAGGDGATGASVNERRSTAPPAPCPPPQGCALLPRPPPLLSPPPRPSPSLSSSLSAPTSAVVHDSLEPPPLPPLPTHLQRHQTTPLQRRVAPPQPPPEADKPSTTTTSTSAGGDEAGSPDPSDAEIVLCVATYNFKAQQPSELSFKEGDIIEVLNRKKSDWWMGRLDGQCGHFPRIFVNLYTPPTPQRDDGDEDNDGLHTPRSPPPLHAQYSSPLSSPPPSLIFGTAPLPPTAGCEPPLDEVWAELREVVPVPKPIVIDASPLTAQAAIIRSDSEESAISPHVLLSSPAPSPPQSQTSQAPEPPGTLYSTESYSSPLSSPAVSPSSSLSDLPSLIAAPLAQHQPRKTVSASPSLASFPPAPGLLDRASLAITSASAPTLPALEPSAYAPSSPAVSLSPSSSASASRSSSVTTSPAATPSTSTTPSPATSPRLPTAAASAPGPQPAVGAASSPATPLRSSAPAAMPATPESLPQATKPSPLAMRLAHASSPPGAGSTTPGSPTPTPGNSKVAALSQSFSAAAATFAGASSANSGPPLSASMSGSSAPSTSSLVQERRKMLFGASAAPTSPMPSPVPQSRTGGGHANFTSQSCAALPSPAVVKPAAPTSVSLKNLPPLKGNTNVHSKPTTTPGHSYAALAKTIGHSASSGTARSSSHPAIPSWVHPNAGGPSSHSAPLSPVHSTATTSPSSSPTSSSPLSTSPSGGTTRKFKEGAPIILSRKNKDGLPVRASTFTSSPPATHLDAAMMSGAPITASTAGIAAAGAFNDAVQRVRRNSSDTPLSLAAVFSPPTRSVMSTEVVVADGASILTGTVVTKASAPPAATTKPVAAGRGRGKVRTRTPQPLGGGKLSQSTAAAPLPEQQTGASAVEVPVAPTAELAEA